MAAAAGPQHLARLALSCRNRAPPTCCELTKCQAALQAGAREDQAPPALAHAQNRMAPSRESVLLTLTYRDLQAIAKECGLKASG